MGTDRTQTDLRGLALQDPRLTEVWAAQSTGLEQAEPLPGIPAPQGSYDLVLSTSGVMTAGQTTQVRTHTGGGTGKAGGSRAVWKKSTDTNYRGKDPSSLIGHWEPIEWADGSGTPAGALQPYAVTLPDQTVVLTYRYMTGSVPSIVVRSRDKTSGAWGSPVTVYTGSVTKSPSEPSMVILPDGKIMLYFWLEISNETNIVGYMSSNDGASWTLINTGLIQTPLDTSGTFGSGNAGYQTRRLRGAYANGQILLVGELLTHDTDIALVDHFIQLASNSLGADFQQVEIATSGTVFLGFPDVISHNNEFLIYSISAAVSAGEIKQTRIGSAFDSISNAYGNTTITGNAVKDTEFFFGLLETTFGGKYIEDGDLAACTDSLGRLYLIATYFGNAGGTGSTKQVGIWRSDNNGDSFSPIGDKQSLVTTASGHGIWWESGDSSTYPSAYAATECQGRIAVIGNHQANPGNEDSSISAFYLGGWSSVTFPSRNDYRTQLDQGVWTRTWVPFDLPGDVGWTAAGTASVESIASTGDLQLQTVAAASRTYTLTGGTSSETEGIICRMRVKVTLGSVISDLVGATFRLADNTNDREIKLRFSPTQMRVLDTNGGSAIATISADFTSPVDVLVAMAESNLQVWYRAGTNGSDRSWTNAVNSTTLTNNTSTPDTNNQIVFGNIGGAATSFWSEFHYAIGRDTGQQMATAQSNPDDLMGEHYAGIGYKTYIDSGLFITAMDGPAFAAEIYDITTRYGFPVERIFAAAFPSPRTTWRSTSTGAQSIAFRFSSVFSTSAESELGNDAICLSLFGVNFRLFQLQGYDVGTSSWVSIGSVDTSSGMNGLNFVRKAGTVTASSGSNLYLHLNELEGSTIMLNPSTFRKIKTNTAGLWSTSTSAKKTTIILEDENVLDPTSGSTGRIIPKNVSVVFNTNGATYAGYRISIDAQTTADGYFEIGNVVLGPIEFFGTQYSWARTIGTTPNTNLTTRLDGSVYSRKYGPAFREVGFAWSAGVDVSPFYSTTISPDYIKAHTGGGPVASVADVPYQMDGFATLLGSDSPVVYLPSIPKGSSAQIVFNRRQESMFGRITSPVEIENVVGDELSDPGEVFRVASVTIRELV